MSEAVRTDQTGIPVPKEVFIGTKRFVKYGISPLKMAEIRAKENPSPKKQDPIMKDGLEYVYNSRGKLVRLERFDPETMEEFILTPESRLTEEQLRQLTDSANRPVVVDEDCPESTPEQLERFRKFGQERNRRRAAMEKAKLGNKRQNKVGTHRPAKQVPMNFGNSLVGFLLPLAATLWMWGCQMIPPRDFLLYKMNRLRYNNTRYITTRGEWIWVRKV